jgi:hypothetical protein
MTATKRERITGLGYDPNFGGIDLSGCPSAQEWPKDASFIDDRFAPMDTTGSGHGSAGLKKFIAEQVAEKTEPSTVHVAGQPFKVYFDNVWHGDGTLNGQRHRMTANDREQLLGKLMNLAKQAIRELTRAEQLAVIRMCQNGQKHEAIGYYLNLALGQSRYADDADVITNPGLLPLMNEIAEFTWFHSTPQAQDTDEWHTFKDDFLNDRPVTHDLLDAAFEAFQEHQKQSRYTLLSSQVEEPKPVDPRAVAASLEEMTDAQVDAAYKGVARELAQSYRR